MNFFDRIIKHSTADDISVHKKSQLLRVAFRQLRTDNITLVDDIDSYKFEKLSNCTIELRIYDGSRDSIYYFDYKPKTTKVIVAYLEPSGIKEVPYGITKTDVTKME